MKLHLEHFIEYAHQLPDSENLITKKCCNLHGHTGKVIIDLEAENEKSSMIVDFKELKNVIDELDHKYLNDIFGFDTPTTAENITKFIYQRIMKMSIHILDLSVSFIEGYHGVNSPMVTYDGD